MGKIWTIRLYPERKSRLYILVLVFQYRKTMIEFWKECKCHGRGRARVQEVLRWTIAKEKNKPLVRDPKIACASFWVKELGNGVVTHELFHATIFWGKRRKLNFAELGTNEIDYEQDNLPFNGVHERLAYAHGELCRQFVSRAYALKLYNQKQYVAQTTVDYE